MLEEGIHREVYGNRVVRDLGEISYHDLEYIVNSHKLKGFLETVPEAKRGEIRRWIVENAFSLAGEQLPGEIFKRYNNESLWFGETFIRYIRLVLDPLEEESQVQRDPNADEQVKIAVRNYMPDSTPHFIRDFISDHINKIIPAQKPAVPNAYITSKAFLKGITKGILAIPRDKLGNRNHADFINYAANTLQDYYGDGLIPNSHTGDILLQLLPKKDRKPRYRSALDYPPHPMAPSGPGL